MRGRIQRMGGSKVHFIFISVNDPLILSQPADCWEIFYEELSLYYFILNPRT
jgi:hypothetical protein